MNIRLGSAPQRRSAGALPIIFAVLLFTGFPGLLSAQAPDPKTPETIPLNTWSVPPRTVISIIGRRDTSRVLDPIRVTGADGPSWVTATAVKKAKQEIAVRARSVDYSGPRFGLTYLPQAAVDSLKAHKIQVGTTITQFGWQLENEIHVSEDGPRVLNEWVFLAGGLESGVFLPSLTWLVGARDRGGNEVGVGPNVSVAGVGLAGAAGVTIHSGGVNFPMNVAVAKSKGGMRVSFLTGFTIH